MLLRVQEEGMRLLEIEHQPFLLHAVVFLKMHLLYVNSFQLYPFNGDSEFILDAKTVWIEPETIT